MLSEIVQSMGPDQKVRELTDGPSFCLYHTPRQTPLAQRFVYSMTYIGATSRPTSRALKYVFDISPPIVCGVHYAAAIQAHIGRRSVSQFRHPQQKGLPPMNTLQDLLSVYPTTWSGLALAVAGVNTHKEDCQGACGSTCENTWPGHAIHNCSQSMSKHQVDIYGSVYSFEVVSSPSSSSTGLNFPQSLNGSNQALRARGITITQLTFSEADSKIFLEVVHKLQNQIRFNELYQSLLYHPSTSTSSLSHSSPGRSSSKTQNCEQKKRRQNKQNRGGQNSAQCMDLSDDNAIAKVTRVRVEVETKDDCMSVIRLRVIQDTDAKAEAVLEAHLNPGSFHADHVYPVVFKVAGLSVSPAYASRIFALSSSLPITLHYCLHTPRTQS